MSSTPSSLRMLTVEHAENENGFPVLLCRGRITLENADVFRTEVKKLSPSHKFVFADLNGVDSVDSSGLGTILGTYISAQKDGCELKLINVHPRVRDLLNITRLTEVLGEKP